MNDLSLERINKSAPYFVEIGKNGFLNSFLISGCIVLLVLCMMTYCYHMNLISLLLPTLIIRNRLVI